MTDKTMTLLASYLDDGGWHTEAENVRNGVDLESYENEIRLIGWITRHLSQPAERGEAQEKAEPADGVMHARIGCDSDTEWFVELVHCLHTVRTAPTFPTREKAEAYLRGIELWLPTPHAERVRVPDGWQLVPLNPSPLMVGEGAWAHRQVDGEIAACYRAMVLSAPPIPLATPSPTIDVAAVREVIAECRRPMPKGRASSMYMDGYNDALNDVADKLSEIIGEIHEA